MMGEQKAEWKLLAVHSVVGWLVFGAQGGWLAVMISMASWKEMRWTRTSVRCANQVRPSLLTRRMSFSTSQLPPWKKAVRHLFRKRRYLDLKKGRLADGRTRCS